MFPLSFCLLILIFGLVQNKISLFFSFKSIHISCRARKIHLGMNIWFLGTGKNAIHFPLSNSMVNFCLRWIQIPFLLRKGTSNQTLSRGYKNVLLRKINWGQISGQCNYFYTTVCPKKDWSSYERWAHITILLKLKLDE